MEDIVTDRIDAKTAAGEPAAPSPLTEGPALSCPRPPLTSVAGPPPASKHPCSGGKKGHESSGTAKLPIRDEATSQHLAGTVELTVIADLKPGLINMRDTTTHATRLRLLLRTLNGLRKARTERAEDSIFPGPIENLQTIHHVSWTIFDNDRKMLMSVVFDQALEPYIRKLVGDGGPVLNAILCHCEGYNGDKGYVAFTDFVRRHQVAVEILAASVTGLTVDDKRYLKLLERQQGAETCAAARDMAAAKLTVGAPLNANPVLTEEVKLRSAKQALQTIAFMYRLDSYFPTQTALPRLCDCDAAEFEQLTAAAKEGDRDRAFFLDLVRSMLPGFDTGWLSSAHSLRQRFASELKWYKEIVCKVNDSDSAAANTSEPKSSNVPHEDIQGNILADYRCITHGCLLLLRLGSPASARTILQFLQPDVTTGETTHASATLNLALTYNGLKAIGLSDEELVKFPKEFREGMQARAGLLGDIGTNHPSKWNLPRANWPLSTVAAGNTVHLSSVDLVIQLQKANVDQNADSWTWCAEHPLYERVAELANKIDSAGGQLLAVEPLRRKLIKGKVHEHFGFLDGLSQPKPNAGSDDLQRVALGEILLGHANDHNDPIEEAEDSILHNGSFMVVRKLAQDVAAFEQFLDTHGEDISREELAAKMVGRNADGTPIVKPKTQTHATDNDFDYADDAEGLKCPFHAHIRRANPRDAKLKGEPVPKVMRRGFAYGPRYEEDAHAERGLMFMAYNANIAQQFEVIQRWISGGNSTGVLSAHSDPLLGVTGPKQERMMSLTHNNKVLRYNLGEKPFVKLEWGMYMFVPSMSALQKLSANKVSAKSYPLADVERGKGLINKFQSLDSVESRADKILRWKKLLEDRSAARYAEDVWAAIRQEKGGVMRTPYGVLVADEALIMEAMRDQGECYSVREFYSRMEQTTGLLYLGIDAKPQPIAGDSTASQHTGKQCPFASPAGFDEAMQPIKPNNVSRYEHESESINRWIDDFSASKAFAHARLRTEAWLEEHLTQAQPLRGEIKIKELVRDVLGLLAAQWFGLPDDDSVQIGGAPATKPHCPEDFILVASYVFYANPTPFVQAKARERGRAMRAEIKRYVTTAIAEKSLPPETLLKMLCDEGAEDDDIDGIARSVAGVTVGFVSPTTGSLLGALYSWIENEDFWRHQQAYLNQQQQQTMGTGSAYEHVAGVLKSPLIRAMQERPKPPLPHRTAVKKITLKGVEIEPGDRVVLGVVSAALQQLEKPAADDAAATRLLFGGNYADRTSGNLRQATAHACPGQNMAFGSMLGIISVLFELEGNLHATGALTLTLNERS